MKLRLALLSIIAAGMLASTSVQAETMAVVNFQEILRNSTAGKSVKDQIDTKQKSFQIEMSKKEDDLNKESESLAQQKAVLSPDAFDKKAKAFRLKTNAAQREVQLKHNELDYALNTSLGEIQKTMLDIVAKIAKDRGYTMVVPASQLIYFDPKMDITNEVLTKLNAELPRVNVSFKLPNSSGRDDE